MKEIQSGLSADFRFESNRPGEITMRPVLSLREVSSSGAVKEAVGCQNNEQEIQSDQNAWDEQEIEKRTQIREKIRKYFQYRDETGECVVIRQDEAAVRRLLLFGLHEFRKLGQVHLSPEVKRMELQYQSRETRIETEAETEAGMRAETGIETEAGTKAEKDRKEDFWGSWEKRLYPYQKAGVSWLKERSAAGLGGILADEMGLGKTVQVIAFLAMEQEIRKENKTLVVCPASLVYHWVHEFRRFAPDLRVMAIVGTAEKRLELLSRVCAENAVEADATVENAATIGAEVVVTSYDLLKRDLAIYEKCCFTYEILDEAQYIKNPRTQVAKAVKTIAAETRFALTGTPIENRLQELWSIFDCIMPGYLYSYAKFRREYEGSILSGTHPEVLEQLKKRIAPWILRRRKCEVLQELPEKTELFVYAGLVDEQKKLYQNATKALIGRLLEMDEETFRLEKIEILTAILRLRQLCCDPSLCYSKYRGNVAKLDLCMELVKEQSGSGHKILLFSQFTKMLDKIAKRLEQQGISYHLLTGATPKERRIEMTNAFAADEVEVFLLSLKAGATGLNLTAADVVILYEPWWNDAIQKQAADRVHRIGQEHPVTVFQLLLEDTLETKMMELQKQKNALAEELLGAGSQTLTDLTRKELCRLLQQEKEE